MEFGSSRQEFESQNWFISFLTYIKIQYTLSESLKSGGKQTLNSKNSDLIDPIQSWNVQSRELFEISGFVYLLKMKVVNFPIRCTTLYCIEDFVVPMLWISAMLNVRLRRGRISNSTLLWVSTICRTDISHNIQPKCSIKLGPNKKRICASV